MLFDQELDRDLLLSRISARTGIAEREQVEHAIEATLEVLAEAALADSMSPEEFYNRVSSREHVGLGFAMEHALVVLQVIAELVSEEERLRLTHKLPAELEQLVRPAPIAPSPDRPTHHGRSRSLAEGNPRGRHPVSESRAERAQRHSIARSDDPHANSRLSSAHPAGEAETIATSREGSEHPLSERHE